MIFFPIPVFLLTICRTITLVKSIPASTIDERPIIRECLQGSHHMIRIRKFSEEEAEIYNGQVPEERCTDEQKTNFKIYTCSPTNHSVEAQ